VARNAHQVVRLHLGKENIHTDSSDTSGITPLLLATVNGHEGVAKLPLMEQIVINCHDSKDITSFVYAPTGGHDKVVKHLLE